MGPTNRPTVVTTNAPRDSVDTERASVISATSDNALDPSRYSNEETRETSKWSARLANTVPRPIRRAWNATIRWTKGPDPPRRWKITPLFPEFQRGPLRLVDRFFPKTFHKVALLVFFYFCWLLVFAAVLHQSAFADEIPGYGAPLQLSCTSTFWADLNYCGYNGEECRPFGNTSYPFRCPASCITAQVLNPHAVGAQEIVYRPLVVGGPTNSSLTSAFYRGDSFICSAAIHAGYISNEDGGCGVVQLIGEQSNYPSVTQNGIDSISFDSNFPLSFSFLPVEHANCKDLRWPLLAVSVTFSALLSVFTASPAVFFFSIWTALFFHVGLVSDQPTFETYYDLVSIAIGGFLPASFCMFVMYRYVVRYTLTGLEAQFEKTVLWLGACWVGALNNYTFDKIPIQRLTPHDVKAQPGGVVALVVICLVIFAIALGQAWAIRMEGKMRPYLALYGTFVTVLLLLIAVPNMNLRIHHYILGLLLLPGTFPQTRPGLVYQGLLVGFFIDGIARWGFDSLLQTATEIIGDGQLGTALPVIAAPLIHGLANITFTWSAIAKDFNGISVLVNEVERFVAYDDGDANGAVDSFTWERQAPPGCPEYFRFGFVDGTTPGDYTQAGIWGADGEWTDMKPGPSD